MIIYSVACTHDGGIGYKNKIPWNIREELLIFKKNTMGSVIVMGRKTFNSIGNIPLKGRHNIVLTRHPSNFINKENLTFTNDFNKIRKMSEKKDIFVIGGSEIFNIFREDVFKIFISFIKDDYKCDTHFDLNILNNFIKIEKKEYNKFNFYIYSRKNV